MSVKTSIARISTAISDAYSVVSSKGGTLPASRTFANLANAILSITTSGSSSGIEKISSSAELTAKLIAANVDVGYIYTGTTDATYTNGHLYVVAEEV